MTYRQQQLLRVTVPLGIGLYLLLVLHSYLGWLFILICAILIYSIVRPDPVTAIIRALAVGQIDVAEDIAREITHPQQLPPLLHNYYTLAQGWIALERSRLDEAQTALSIAVTRPLRTSNDLALAHVLLARVYFQQNQPERASEELAAAQKHPHNALVQKEIEKLLSQRDNVIQ